MQRAERVMMRTRSVRIGVRMRLGTRSLPRAYIPHSFPYIFLRLLPRPLRRKAKRRKEMRCGLFRHFVLQKAHKVATLPNSLFSVLVAPEALPSPRFVIVLYTLTLRKHLALAAHIRSRGLLGVCFVFASDFDDRSKYCY